MTCLLWRVSFFLTLATSIRSLNRKHRRILLCWFFFCALGTHTERSPSRRKRRWGWYNCCKRRDNELWQITLKYVYNLTTALRFVSFLCTVRTFVQLSASLFDSLRSSATIRTWVVILCNVLNQWILSVITFARASPNGFLSGWFFGVTENNC